MIELNLWWQGFVTAVGLYFVFVLGQIIGYYKSSNDYDYFGDENDKYR